jgi:L,D-transpeptidase ErfK/SrfK
MGLCLSSPLVHGEVAPQFVVHGTPRNCSSITQLDSALSANFQAFFAGWSERDYLDAVAWAGACSEFGWHLPGRPRMVLLQAQHDQVFGLLRTPPGASATAGAAQQVHEANELAAAAPVVSHAAASPVAARIAVSPVAAHAAAAPIALRAPVELPADGSPVIGNDMTTTSHYQDTLFDIARRYGLGYEEIIRANPGVDIWVPGEGTRILLPSRRILPPGLREGIVVNLPEHRLYYFPKPVKNAKPVVITYPVSIGKAGSGTPLGQTYVTAKIEHPSWYPTQSIRKDHAVRGDPLPRVVAPGPDNPIGDFKMRLGFGDGTYEIHGTNKPVTVGTAATYGCIGMYPEDLAALYALIAVGTPVRFINVQVKAAWSGGALLLEAHPAVDNQRQSTAPTIDQLADALREAVQDARTAIRWDRAREVLRNADGIIATVGLQRQ